MLRNVFSVGALALTGLLASSSVSAAEAPLSWKHVMQSWVGSWSCVTTSPRGTHTWSETATMLGSKWIRFVGYFHPGEPFEALIGYDVKQHQWVTVFVDSSGGGDYSISRSSASPQSLVQNWVDEYPIDPHDGSYTLAMTKHGYIETAATTRNGRTIVIKDECKKTLVVPRKSDYLRRQ